jgi:hypothetical protein
MTTRYQIVLQLPGDSLANLDALVALEDQLIDELEGVAQVDGHDIGSNEGNIFIVTGKPIDTFARIRPLLEGRNLLRARREWLIGRR